MHPTFLWASVSYLQDEAGSSLRAILALIFANSRVKDVETESSHSLSLEWVEVGLERKFGQQRGLLGPTCGSCSLESSVSTISRDMHASLRTDGTRHPVKLPLPKSTFGERGRQILTIIF